MRALLFAGIGCLLIHSTFAIQAVSNDLDTGGGFANFAYAYKFGVGLASVVQGNNLPPVLALPVNDLYLGTTAQKRMTKETFVKYYVKCYGATEETSTYTLSYALDGAPAKVVGSAYTKLSNPFILIEGLEVGDHTLTVTCQENKLSNTAKTAPLTDIADSSPLVFNWIVADLSDIDVKFDSATPDVYTNSASTPLSFSADMTYNANYHQSVAWTCTVNDDASMSCGSGVAASTTVDQSTASDGKYSFKTKVTVTYYTDCTAWPLYCSDLTPQTGEKGTSWILDRTKPEVAVTSFPAAKSQYTEGKKVKFEFACKSGEVSCTYFCSLDGFNSPDYDADDKEKGYFKCTSPLKLAVKNSTTHSFRLYAVDAAGNPSYASIPSDQPMYMFYADGTGPTVEFTRMDATTVGSASQLLAAGSQYYALDNDVTITSGALTLATGLSAAASIVDGSLPFTASDGTTGTAFTLRNDYHTVLQFDYNPSKAVYELEDGAYGAILAMKAVNGLYYYNVLDTTNADFGTLNFKCIHTEFA